MTATSSPQSFGIDIGSECIKIVSIVNEGGKYRSVETCCVEHHKQPHALLLRLLKEKGWGRECPTAVTGRLSRGLSLYRIPTKAALARGVRFTHPEFMPGTIVSIGSHGYSVLELRQSGKDILRENSRCSQGTGNFLSQLVGRFGLSVQEASRLSCDVAKPVMLSGRCPVILKTDMTHLANKGEDRAAIVAGLYDAVCENVQTLLKPGLTPPRVMLAGGVALAPRVQNNFRTFLKSRDMMLEETPEGSSRYLEALGAALIAAAKQTLPPSLDAVIEEKTDRSFTMVPSLQEGLSHVTRLSVSQSTPSDEPQELILGFDIGSTGSKALAINAGTRTPIWETYLDTLGDPVTAAQRLTQRYLEEIGGKHSVRGIGVTGSGRDIVGSLMNTCFGTESVLIMNEIAAHAEGALYYDPLVDTIFEIGGQDAKYTRLDNGNIIDAAMNEACSAGTGSFIAEQGKCFEGITDVMTMNEVALSAESGVSLGQHCSVFMAEVIADAVAAKIPQPSILAGLYDSIAQNFLNRVKGNRSVGKRIFCQGMPFTSDALAAAIARQTGRDVVVPPNPGTMGALGIALIGQRDVPPAKMGLDLSSFLNSEVISKDTFVCASTQGCGGTGNKCRIDRIETRVQREKKRFLWGGGCSLYTSGGRSKKLPDHAPDPFRERRELVRELIEAAAVDNGGQRIGVVEEFALKGLLPFFLSFFTHLGLRPTVVSTSSSRILKRGMESANVLFCAPMLLYQGAVDELLEQEALDFLFLPRVRELLRQGDELHSTTCPLVQASPDVIRSGIRSSATPQILTPRIDIGPGNLDSDRFKQGIRSLARDLGKEGKWSRAYACACNAQREFDARCRDAGQVAVDFARRHGLETVVVLGRNYTIHNDLLNSNVPSLLRAQGVVAVPIDCYPLKESAPVFQQVYWASSQLILRVAHEIAQEPDQYAVYCSNYSCGPDSFTLHFFAYLMGTKPFAVIETDGHTGDAGTKTRLEAFLYCVEGDRRRACLSENTRPLNDFDRLKPDEMTILDACRDNEMLLIPRMGPAAEALGGLMRAYGVCAEALPPSTRESFRLGQQHTTGKECAPLTITLGSLMSRIREDPDPSRKFAYLMPSANGPCRFGMYNLLQRLVLDTTGLGKRVRIVSPSDEDYYAGVPLDFQLRTFACFVASDVLQAALHDVRPVEIRPGTADALYKRYNDRLKSLMENTVPRASGRSVWEMLSGVFGLVSLLRLAAEEFAAVKDATRDVPTVAVVGEIYVRLDPYANGHVIEELEKRGLRCRLAPLNEWLMYCTDNELQRFSENRVLPGDSRLGAHVSQKIQEYIVSHLYGAVGKILGWNASHSVRDIVRAATPYISPELISEAVLSLGVPVESFRSGEIDGVVAVGPHECMPNKIVESQLFHVCEHTGMHTLAVSVNGEPIDPDILDRFAFEVLDSYGK